MPCAATSDRAAPAGGRAPRRRPMRSTKDFIERRSRTRRDRGRGTRSRNLAADAALPSPAAGVVQPWPELRLVIDGRKAFRRALLATYRAAASPRRRPADTGRCLRRHWTTSTKLRRAGRPRPPPYEDNCMPFVRPVTSGRSRRSGRGREDDGPGQGGASDPPASLPLVLRRRLRGSEWLAMLWSVRERRCSRNTFTPSGGRSPPSARQSSNHHRKVCSRSSRRRPHYRWSRCSRSSPSDRRLYAARHQSTWPPYSRFDRQRPSPHGVRRQLKAVRAARRHRPGGAAIYRLALSPTDRGGADDAPLFTRVPSSTCFRFHTSSLSASPHGARFYDGRGTAAFSADVAS